MERRLSDTTHSIADSSQRTDLPSTDAMIPLQTQGDFAAGAKSSDLMELSGKEVNRAVPSGVATTLPRSQSKRRVRTSELRKEEIEHLQKKTRGLESTLDLLKSRVGIIIDNPGLDQQVLNNVLLRETLRNQQLLLAGFRSAMAADTSEHIGRPVSATIHLGSDSDKRRELLLEIKPQKLYDARRFIENRTRFNHPRKPASESVRFQTPSGDTCITKCDIIPLCEAISVKQVYDALLKLEIDSADASGDVMVREVAENGDRSALHHTFAVSKRHGVEVEAHRVLFAEYVPPSHTHYHHQVSPESAKRCDEALITIDVVDQDDMYPHRPSLRLREDITSIFLVHASQPVLAERRDEAQREDPVVGRKLHQNGIVLTRWVHAKLHRSELNIPEDALIKKWSTLDIFHRVDDAPKIASSKECIAVTNGAPHWSSSESELFGNWCIALPRRSTKSEDCEMHTSSSAATSSNNRTRTLPLSRKRARMRDAGRRSPEMDRAEPQHAEDGSVEADSQRTSRGATTIGKRKASAAKPHREPKQRIRTSQLRKEEIELLQKKTKLLEAELRFFKHRARIADESSLDQQLLKSVLLREALRNQQFLIAGLRSVMAGDTSEHVRSPVSTIIHLGSDPEKRRAQMLEMKHQKLHDAKRFLENRTRFTDVAKPFSESTQFQTADGDTCVVKFDVVPVSGATSVKQVYDALLFYCFNLEICTAEVTGGIVVREEADTGDENVAHNRLVYPKKGGVSIETNNVVFAEYTAPRHQQQHRIFPESGAEGLVTTDFVDQDDIYPYRPHERIREDVTSIFMVQSCQSSKKSSVHQENVGSREQEQVIVLTRWVQAKLHRSELAVPGDALTTVSEEMNQVNDAIVAAVRSAFRTLPQGANIPQPVK